MQSRKEQGMRQLMAAIKKHGLAASDVDVVLESAPLEQHEVADRKPVRHDSGAVFWFSQGSRRH
jgi:hypothetical protein